MRNLFLLQTFLIALSVTAVISAPVKVGLNSALSNIRRSSGSASDLDFHTRSLVDVGDDLRNLEEPAEEGDSFLSVGSDIPGHDNPLPIVGSDIHGHDNPLPVVGSDIPGRDNPHGSRPLSPASDADEDEDEDRHGDGDEDEIMQAPPLLRQNAIWVPYWARYPVAHQ